LLAEERAGEADDRGVVGEDADDVRAAADLLVDALERVGNRYERRLDAPCDPDRLDARGVRVGEYGATVRTGASGSKRRSGRP
jgi:hypothetical protein